MSDDLEEMINTIIKRFDGNMPNIIIKGQEPIRDYVWNEEFEMPEIIKDYSFSPQDFVDIIKQQQAEIKRLKAKQVWLRPMKELEALIEEQESGYHDGSMVYAVDKTGKKEILRIESNHLFIGGTGYSLSFFKGWLDLSDLPTEMEE